ncbi:hypothetical protein SAMN05421847_2041 [Halpernia humi]|uniref:Uncharacterized protein n=1 Tax=Halpernia humi TaxID=493375 RepID=A0A1H5Z7W1_9FLAO|nr:hypothetical protein SAMN05421847_2041 [Halpernia humi]
MTTRKDSCDSVISQLSAKPSRTLGKIVPKGDFSQRLRLYAVRDCGLLSCPPTPNFERGRMLELPLKPLLHIAFVRAMCIIFLEVFKYKFHYFVFTQTDFFFVPNFRFRCHFLNFSLLSKMVIRISFLAKWFVSNRTIV